MPSVSTTPDLRLDERHTRHLHIDHDLALPRRGIRRFAWNQHLGASETDCPDYSHTALSLPFVDVIHQNMSWYNVFFVDIKLPHRSHSFSIKIRLQIHDQGDQVSEKNVMIK
ncbi:hypothetical protein ACFQZE_04450 [Paenibacillus sp. GCM10027627]